MISRVTGEVDFADGLHLRADQSVDEILPGAVATALPIPGWQLHRLGRHLSDYGEFEVEAVSGREKRLCLVLISHRHTFYEPGTPDDNERQVFHEGILARDLGGQREFSWGQAFSHLNPIENKNWLIVAYGTGPQIPMQAVRALIGLKEVNDERD